MFYFAREFRPAPRPLAGRQGPDCFVASIMFGVERWPPLPPSSSEQCPRHLGDSPHALLDRFK